MCLKLGLPKNSAFLSLLKERTINFMSTLLNSHKIMQRVPSAVITSTVKNIFKSEKTQTHILHIFRNVDNEMRYVLAGYYQYLVHSGQIPKGDN